MRLALGTAALVVGLAFYSLVVMAMGGALLPESLVARTGFYALAGIAWVWPAARLTGWIIRGGKASAANPSSAES